MAGRPGTCGYQAIAAVTGKSVTRVREQLLTLFGTDHINGVQMRSVANLFGWQWVYRHCAECFKGVPAHGKYVVVTRRGFYAQIDGWQNMHINAPICGYYIVS